MPVILNLAMFVSENGVVYDVLPDALVLSGI